MAFEAASPAERPVARPLGANGSVIAVAAIVLASLAVHFATPHNPDVSWLITVNERMLAGQRLYADIFEVNPPMSAWLYSPWVWLASRIGASPETMVTLGTTAFTLTGVAAAGRTIARAGLLESRAAWWIAASLALCAAPIITFAQREHFAIVAALPMLACAASRAAGRAPTRAEAVVAGLFAGLALSIKPHFGLGLLLPAVYAAYRTRSLRPVFALDNFVAAGVFALYVAAAAIWAPAFFTEMLPIAKTIYAADRQSLPFLLAPAHVLLLFGVMVTLFATRGALFSRPLFATLAASIAGFAVVYLIQGRGWAYHLLPATTLAIIAFVLALASTPLRAGGGRLAVLLFAGVLAAAPIADFFRWRNVDEALRDVVAPYGPGLKIALISGEHAFTNPLQREIGATVVNRGPSLWRTLSALRLRGQTDDPELIRVYDDAMEKDRAMLRDDMLRTKPDLVLVDAVGFDWLGWARQDPAIARLLDGYEVRPGVVGGDAVLKILVSKSFVSKTPESISLAPPAPAPLSPG